MKNIINFLKGMIIGIANVIPGVSGGTMAVSMGIYEKLVQTVGNFFKDFKKNFKSNIIFLLPLILGAGLAILAFSKLIEYLLSNHSMQTRFAFIGLILGSVPFIAKKSVQKGFSWKYLIPGIVCFGIGVTLAVLEMLGITGTEIESFDINFINIILLFVYGIISAASMVVPGISGSFILLLLGAYSAIISAISSLNILVLIPFGIGVLLGIILASKLIDFLLHHFYGYTYFAIIGFVVGSLLAIYPGFSFDIVGIASIICLILGFVSSFFISKYTNKE